MTSDTLELSQLWRMNDMTDVTNNTENNFLTCRGRWFRLHFVKSFFDFFQNFFFSLLIRVLQERCISKKPSDHTCFDRF